MTKKSWYSGTWNFANCSEPPKNTENFKSRPGRAKKALAWWIRDLDKWGVQRCLRMDRETFNFILCRIEQGIIKEPTVMVPNPIEPHRQLALTPGSTHDARLLRHCSLFRTICNGGGIPNKSVTLGMEI